MNVQALEKHDKRANAFETGEKYGLIRLLCWTVCIGFALLETWSQRQFINEDGISYLDMSDALLRHNWHLLINPIWSPLYPLLIGVITWLTHPSARWEVPTVHLVNLLIFVGALASFEFLLRETVRSFGHRGGPDDTESAGLMPAWVWQVLGYSFFAWSTFGMMWAPRMVTPDLCVAAFIYLDAALLLNLRTSANTVRVCLLLGLTLGCGYLAKAILFPMAFVFMVVAFCMIREREKSVLPLFGTFLLFGAIAAPLFIAMSIRVGRPSYSEVGNLNYAWHVNHVGGGKAAGGPFFPAVAGPPPYLKHALTLLHEDPEVFSFKEPIAYTYPPRQDMEYWGAGTSADFDVRNQARAVFGNLRIVFTDPHIAPLSGLIAMGFVILLARRITLARCKSALKGWPLLVPGIVGPCLYLVIAVEPRYVAPFFVLVLLGLIPGVPYQSTQGGARRTAIATIAVGASAVILSGLLVGYHLAGFPRGERPGLFLQVGEFLNRAGVAPGEEVGIIGDSSDGCRWARLARVRIAAQILREDVDIFWQLSDPRLKEEVYDAFKTSGAKAIVAEAPPPPGAYAGWQRLGNTNYYVHMLARAESK